MKNINNECKSFRPRRAKMKASQHYKVTMPKKRWHHQKTNKNKLQLNTHTQERMCPPFMKMYMKDTSFDFIHMKEFSFILSMRTDGSKAILLKVRLLLSFHGT